MLQSPDPQVLWLFGYNYNSHPENSSEDVMPAYLTSGQ